MPIPVPYLGFNGNCAEAMRFYETVLDGKLEVLLTGADSPAGAQIPKEFANLVLNARLRLKDGGYLYGGDAPPHMDFKGIQGISVTLSYDTAAEAQAVFEKLAAGGKVTMPMAPSFWARTFGMLVDKFGVPWIINGELLPL